MQIRLSIEKDIPQIEKIISDARKYLADFGIDQWQEQYPTNDMLKKDIDLGTSFVIDDNGKIAATMSLSFLPDKHYDSIEGGRWLSPYEYGVLHRVAISQEYRGRHLVDELFKFAKKTAIENGIRSLRIDTHEGNPAMKTAIKRNGYTKCGVVSMGKAGLRDAFELITIDFLQGDRYILKKKHPCGGDEFEVERLGMDIRLKCQECGSSINLERKELKRRIKKRL